MFITGHCASMPPDSAKRLHFHPADAVLKMLKAAAQIDGIPPSWQIAIMIKTQVQIPDELFERAKRLAAEQEWSFAEIVRRGLEQMVLRYPMRTTEVPGGWRLPEAVDLGLTTDPFADPNWREEANLGTGTARMIAERLREQAARYDEGT